jgi:sugar phosphate isomerase/epimerase
LSLIGLASQLHALEPIVRSHSRIKGMSLAAYSLRSEMKWFKGKPSKGNIDMLDFLEFCAKTQFDAAELTAYFFQEPLKSSYINQIKRRAHLLGLDLSGGAIGNNFCYQPSSEQGKAQMKYTVDWIDRYADMGIPVIRIFAGRYPKGMTEAVALENIYHNLEQALTHAEKRGIILGMENHDSMTHIDKFINFIQKVDSPFFGVTWDSANISTQGDPYEELAKLAPYTVNAQVKVKTPLGGKKVETDFSKIVKILNRARYAGYLTLEYEEKEDPYREIPRFKALIEKNLST